VGGTDPARRRPDPAPETGGGEERRGEVAVREEGVGEGEERRGRGRGRGEAGTRAEPTSAQPPAAAAARTAAGGGGGPRRRSGRGEGRRRGVPPESPTRAARGDGRVSQRWVFPVSLTGVGLGRVGPPTGTGIWSLIPLPGYFFGHEDMGYFDGAAGIF